MVLGAKYLSYVKPIATYDPKLFGDIILVLASVMSFYEMDRRPSKIRAKNCMTAHKILAHTIDPGPLIIG